jgi:hypothetical protein
MQITEVPPVDQRKSPGLFERHEGSGRYFDDNSATPRTGGAGASAGRRPVLFAMEGGVDRDHVEIDAGVDHSSGSVYSTNWRSLARCVELSARLGEARLDRCHIASKSSRQSARVLSMPAKARAATSTTTRRRPGGAAPGRQPAEGRSSSPWRASSHNCIEEQSHHLDSE